MDLNLIGNIAIVVVVTVVIVAGITKLYGNHLIKKSVDIAIEFAEHTGKTGRDKLIRAVTYIENIVLTKKPIFLKQIADNLIKNKKINP